ncbi:hypothetical protein F7Q91_02870 [Vibrio chagasii]|uniref:Phosphoadenosine phosphosulphate reductase domain-containing protein n=1 Tax=Vibrio chagasii TaxID=170679 RepID=A0A7V7NX33_9VIBR|nr:hypothetical protein [Vibrio chagasii]KAB0482363.1 hypothetical protein F7Q91_02870 [Vibrio chagasii]
MDIIETTASIEGELYKKHEDAIGKFNAIVAEFRMLLESSCNRIIFIPLSMGKDSSYVANAGLEAYRQCLEAGTIEKTRPLIISTGDPLAEAIPMIMYTKWAAPKLKSYAEKHGINLYYETVSPAFHEEYANKYLTAQKFIPNASRSGDCSVILKVVPSERFVKSLLDMFAEDPEMQRYRSSDVICATGQRLDEGVRRKTNMQDQETANKNLQDLVSELPKSDINTNYNLYLYAPIRDLLTEQVFTTLELSGVKPITRNLLGKTIPAFLPDFGLLLAIYGNASSDSCEIAVGTKATAGCNGKSRYGCGICTMVSTDSTQESLAKLDRWNALQQQELLRVRDYLFLLSTKNDKRMFHAKGFDKVGFSRVAFQPNALRVEYLEKLVRYFSQLSIESIKRADAFKKLVDNNEVHLHPGIKEIQNDPTLNAKARRAMLEMYTEQAQKPVIELFSLRHAIFLSFRWALDGVNSLPYRPLKIWDDLIHGRGWIPYPELKSDYEKRHGNVSIVDKVNPLPEAKMFKTLLVDGDEKNYIQNYRSLLQYWQRPLDTADILTDTNCTVEDVPLNQLPYSIQYTHSHDLVLESSVGIPIRAFINSSYELVGYVCKGSHHFIKSTLCDRKVDEAFENEFKLKQFDQVLNNRFNDWVRELSFDIESENFNSKDSALDYLKRSFKKAYPEGINTIKVNLPYMQEIDLPSGYQQKERKVSPALNFTKRTVKKSNTGVITKGLTRLSFYDVQTLPRLHLAHSDQKRMVSADYGLSSENIKSVFNPEFTVDSSPTLGDRMNIIVNEKTISRMKLIGFYDKAIQHHDAVFKQNIKEVRKSYSSAVRQTIRKGSCAGIALEMVAQGVVQISKSYLPTFKNLSRRTELFEELGCFDYQHLSIKELNQLPFLVDMKQHRHDKAKVLLEIRARRNSIRKQVRKHLAFPSINIKSRILAFIEQLELAIAHYSDCSFLASQKAAFVSSSISQKASLAKAWLLLNRDSLSSTQNLLKKVLSKNQLDLIANDTSLQRDIYKLCETEMAKVLGTINRSMEKWSAIKDVNQEYQRLTAIKMSGFPSEFFAEWKGTDIKTRSELKQKRCPTLDGESKRIASKIRREYLTKASVMYSSKLCDSYGFTYLLNSNENSWSPNLYHLAAQLKQQVDIESSVFLFLNSLSESLCFAIKSSYKQALAGLSLSNRVNYEVLTLAANESKIQTFSTKTVDSSIGGRPERTAAKKKSKYGKGGLFKAIARRQVSNG